MAGWWYLWVPQWRPELKAGERYGIDISAHQGLIDWARVAKDEITFAYIKATEGGDFVDARFEENWAAARSAEIDRGAYHFFTLCSPGGEQAENFLQVAPPTDEALPPAVDLELAGNCSNRPPLDDVEENLADFVAIVEDAWRSSMVLYIGDDWESAYPTRERLNRPLWVRRFLLRPESEWSIWQLHGHASVQGIAGGTDLDIGRDLSP